MMSVLVSVVLGLSAEKVTVTIHPDQVVGRVGEDFIGLSYEAANLGKPSFFSPDNKNLVALFKRLSRKGILRIGGNTCEYTDWAPDDDAAKHPYKGDEVFKDINTHARTAITAQAFRNLGGFLKATGWKLVYSGNLGTGTPETAAEEVKALCSAAGRRLMAVQVGNEPDLFKDNGLRDKSYAFKDFFKEWQAFESAIKKTNPNVPIAGPDTCWDWVPDFTAQIKPGQVSFLSSHFYWSGPPTDPKVTIDSLLNANGWFDYNMDRDMKAARASGLEFRNTEGNSCYRGGKAGVSDVFASALWASEYCMRLATYGAAGATFHSGGVAIYSPIAGDQATGYTARPEYYGLLLVSQFQGSQLVKCDLSPSFGDVFAYAAKVHGRTLVLVGNKSRDRDISVDLGSTGLKMWRLTAPSLESKDGVTLAGSAVGPDGAWRPKGEPADGTVLVPHASAALIQLG